MGGFIGGSSAATFSTLFIDSTAASAPDALTVFSMNHPALAEFPMVLDIDSNVLIHVDSGADLNFNVEIPSPGIVYALIQPTRTAAVGDYGPNYFASVKIRYTFLSDGSISISGNTLITGNSGIPITFNNFSKYTAAGFLAGPYNPPGAFFTITYSAFGAGILTFTNVCTIVTRGKP